MKNILKIALSGAAVAALSTSVQAVPVETVLGLSLDGSGSINSSEFDLQRDAYANAFSNTSLVPADGSVVVYANQFSSTVETVAPAVRIQSAADRNAIVGAFNSMNQLNAGTNIGIGIDDVVSSLNSFLSGLGAGELASDIVGVIDVSTDGFGSGADTAADNAVADPNFDQVNCLGVGFGSDCSFIAGSDSFSNTVGSFDDFDQALQEKIGTELGTTPTVPEPSTLMLFGLALFGLFAFNRRRHWANVA